MYYLCINVGRGRSLEHSCLSKGHTTKVEVPRLGLWVSWAPSPVMLGCWLTWSCSGLMQVTIAAGGLECYHTDISRKQGFTPDAINLPPELKVFTPPLPWWSLNCRGRDYYLEVPFVATELLSHHLNTCSPRELLVTPQTWWSITFDTLSHWDVNAWYFRLTEPILTNQEVVNKL